MVIKGHVDAHFVQLLKWWGNPDDDASMAHGSWWWMCMSVWCHKNDDHSRMTAFAIYIYISLSTTARPQSVCNKTEQYPNSYIYIQVVAVLCAAYTKTQEVPWQRVNVKRRKTKHLLHFLHIKHHTTSTAFSTHQAPQNIYCIFSGMGIVQRKNLWN